MSVWIVEGDNIDISDKALNIVYYNDKVREFLYDGSQWGISSAKGFGKTFLMKVKRKQLQNKEGVTCLPRDIMVDVPGEISLKQSVSKYMEDYYNWVNLWTVSIGVSLLNDPIIRPIFTKDDFSSLSENTKKMLESKAYIVCDIFNILLSKERQELKPILDDAAQIFNLIAHINKSICIFIDRVDEAFRRDIHQVCGDSRMSRGPRNASYWQYAQFGLAEAVHRIHGKRKQIKIFYTIRAEALVDAYMLSPQYQQIMGDITELSYSYQDLYEMFKLYIANEEDDELFDCRLKNEAPELAFVGFKTLEHGYISGNKEDIFSYIYRHTLKRPRDIMDICNKLCNINIKKEGIPLIRTIVNRKANEICKAYMAQQDPFVINLKFDDVPYLLKNLNTNIFDFNYMKYVCKKYNSEISRIKQSNIEQPFACIKKCSDCTYEHPFCNLFNIGLLGIIEKNNSDKYYKQKYLTPGNSIINLNKPILPRSRLYFLHPSLSNLAEKKRKDDGLEFKTSDLTIVGDERKIDDDPVLKIEHSVNAHLGNLQTNRIFISSTCYDLENERITLKNNLERLGYEIIMSDTDNFNTKLENTHSHDHCIDEMLKCSQIICIIAKRYGGEYTGRKYSQYLPKNLVSEKNIKWFIDEKTANDFIMNPSISFVEYSIAKYFRKKVYVYLLEEVSNEKNSYRKNIKEHGFNPAFANDNRIFEMIQFVTHQQTENWISNYNNLAHLNELLTNKLMRE